MRRIIVLFAVVFVACVGPAGKDGVPGPEGPAGSAGSNGMNGSNGGSGSNATSTQSPETWTSGTRIVARATTTTTTTADGLQHSQTFFGGYFDTTRNEACSPGLASDGATRCLPFALTALGIYGDSACTIPVAEYSPSCGSVAPAYVAVLPATATCPPTTGASIYAAGTPYTSYYAKVGAACDGPTTIGSIVWIPPSGAEISPQSFAAMNVTTTTQ